MTVIFAKTRYQYDSYGDYRKLIELSGFPTCFVDEIDLESEDFYIISPANGELRPHLSARTAALKGPQRSIVVFWNLERPDSNDMKGRSIDNKIRDDHRAILQYVDAVWSSDRWVANVDPPTVYVTMGSHPGLSMGRAKLEAKWDLAHLSYVSPRRSPIYHKIGQAYSLAPTGWGEERDKILRSSRAMLNIHQTNAPILEPLRIAVAAAYKMPYITEYTRDSFPLEHRVNCLMAPADGLLDMLGRAWGSDLGPLGENLHSRLCVETDFRRGVEEGVQKTMEALWREETDRPFMDPPETPPPEPETLDVPPEEEAAEPPLGG
ncbi:MAG TPA: hypothetical protein VEN81_11340 [Planctomycetota bacterium]|nr:hypothetical protein [Planctomycetota bacterium]